MNLKDLLYQKTVDSLKELAQLTQNCRGLNRKEELVRCLIQTLSRPTMLRQLWLSLDELSKKAVAAAYYNGGHFDQTAFVAQYGQLPPRPQTRGWRSAVSLLDLFIYDDRYLPDDLMPLLVEWMPPQDKFQVKGQADPPQTVRSLYGNQLKLISAETELTGLHDLTAYLHLAAQGELSISPQTGDTTLASYRKILDNLLAGDFFPLPEKYRASQIIRPTGLDVFARGAKLVRPDYKTKRLQLSETGRVFYQTQEPEVLLEGFIEWTETGHFDELSRISAIKGQNSGQTRLSEPHTRREAVIEALSWCPLNVWISLEEFYRAIKIWHFDFEVEMTPYSHLYVGYKDYGMMYGETYWFVVKGSYINILLWEYLGSLGALDLLYTYPEVADFKLYGQNLYYDETFISIYDGLKYFRINSLGAYLLGQTREYLPSQPREQEIFQITAKGEVMITHPARFTPAARSKLALMAVPAAKNRYQLDAQQVLSSIEAGNDWQHLLNYLSSHHQGPLPPEVSGWFEKLKQNSQAFKSGGSALLIKVQSAELIQMVMADPLLQKFSYQLDSRTLVIPANKEKVFRTRLKELEYLLF